MHLIFKRNALVYLLEIFFCNFTLLKYRQRWWLENITFAKEESSLIYVLAQPLHHEQDSWQDLHAGYSCFEFRITLPRLMNPIYPDILLNDGEGDYIVSCLSSRALTQREIQIFSLQDLNTVHRFHFQGKKMLH